MDKWGVIMAVFSDGGSQQSSTVTKLTVIEESYSSIDNSSVVSWKLTMSVAGWNFSGWSVTSKVWLDGELIYNKTKQTSIGKNSTVTLASGTKTIYHNEDGKKTLSCKAETSTSTSQSYLPGTAIPSGNLKLTDILRQSQFDISNWSTNATPVEQSKSLKIIEGNSDYYTELVVRLVQEPDSYLVKRKGINSGTYNFQFTEEELNNIVYPKIVSNSRNISFQLRTYSDSLYENLIGMSTATPWYTATIINANPIFSDFEYEDSNSTTIALTGNSNKIVQGYSTLKVTIPVEDKATGQKGATISGYNIGNYSVAYSDTTDVVKEIPNYQNENIVVSAVDSRGNSKSITKLFTDNFINYTDVVILNCEVSREDEIGEKVKIKFDGTWWQSNFGGANGGGVLNELTAIYQYQTGNGEWINGTTLLTLNVSEFGKFSCEQYIVGDTGNGFNISNSYKIKVIVSDKLSSKPNTKELIAGEPAIAIFGNKIALHNKYDESRSDIPIQLYGKTTIDDELLNKQIGDIVITSTNENPASRLGGNWELVDKDFIEIAGNFKEWFTPSSNVTLNNFYVVRSKHSMKVRLDFTNKVALSDTAVVFGNIDYSSLGITDIGMSYSGSIAVTDGGNGIAEMNLHYSSGELSSVDVITKTSGGQIAANSSINYLIDINVRHYEMLDEACDKFYWKKVA